MNREMALGQEQSQCHDLSLSISKIIRPKGTSRETFAVVKIRSFRIHAECITHGDGLGDIGMLTDDRIAIDCCVGPKPAAILAGDRESF
jgi:hypothetical protein